MKTTKVLAAVIGAALIPLITLVAVPASAASPLNYAIDCSYSGPDITAEIPIYAGQDAVFSFAPATCTDAYWSYMNSNLSNDNALSGTSSTTIAAADVVCDSEFEIVTANNDYYYLTFTGCGAEPAPAPGPNPDALPDTGISPWGLGVFSVALVLAGSAAYVVMRRRAS